MSASTPDGGLIDFHSHYYEQEWSAFPAHQKPGILLQAWPLLTDIDGQLAAMDTASVFHTTMNGVIGLSPEQKEKLKNNKAIFDGPEPPSIPLCWRHETSVQREPV